MRNPFFVLEQSIQDLGLRITKEVPLNLFFKKQSRCLKVGHKVNIKGLKRIKNSLGEKRLVLLSEGVKHPVVIANLQQEYPCLGFNSEPTVFDPIGDCAWDTYESMVSGRRYQKYALFRAKPTLLHCFININGSILSKYGFDAGNSQIGKVITDYRGFAQSVVKELRADAIAANESLRKSENDRIALKLGVQHARKLHPNDIVFDNMLQDTLLDRCIFGQQSVQLQLLSKQLHLLLDIVFGHVNSDSRIALRSILMEHLQLTSIDVVNRSVELEFLFNLLDYNFMNQVHEYFQNHYMFFSGRQEYCFIPYKNSVFYVPSDVYCPKQYFGFKHQEKLVGHLNSIYSSNYIVLLKTLKI